MRSQLASKPTLLVAAEMALGMMEAWWNGDTVDPKDWEFVHDTLAGAVVANGGELPPEGDN